MTPSEALADLRERLADMQATAHPGSDRLAEVVAALEPPGNGPGILEVGANDRGEVVVNLPRDMTGHIVFSAQEAHDFAHLLVRKALEAQPSTGAHVIVSFEPEDTATVCPACVIGNPPPVRVRLCVTHAAMAGAKLDLTNHHSALTCPYCNPHALKLEEPPKPQVVHDPELARLALGLPVLHRDVGPGLLRAGGHVYAEDGTSDCANGCGCWAGPSRSGGPDGVDPFGACPKDPRSGEDR